MHILVRELAERRLPVIRRDPSLRWAAGFGLFALAFVLRWALESVLPVGLPFVTFFIAVLAAGLVGGAVVGLTVLGLCFVSSWFFFVAPRFSFQLDGSSATALVMFALFGLAIVAIAHELNITVERLLAERRRSDELLKKSTRAEEKLAELNRELLHRIRNIFTVATSIATQTSRYVSDPTEMANALASRFQALAVAQELLVANDLVGADLKHLAAETLKPMAPDAERLIVTGPSIQLSAETTTSLCLVLHELATNAMKHGAWSNTQGSVDIEWSVARDGTEPLVMLRWREKDGPACEMPAKTGLGSMLIDNAVSGATVKRQFLPDGLNCSMEFAQPSI
jgi:two-component sensor histidine kinase